MLCKSTLSLEYSSCSGHSNPSRQHGTSRPRTVRDRSAMPPSVPIGLLLFGSAALRDGFSAGRIGSSRGASTDDRQRGTARGQRPVSTKSLVLHPRAVPGSSPFLRQNCHPRLIVG